jgi:hypothetical protein
MTVVRDQMTADAPPARQADDARLAARRNRVHTLMRRDDRSRDSKIRIVLP